MLASRTAVATAAALRGAVRCASSIRVDNPYTGEIVAEVPFATAAEARATVHKAAAAQKSWASSSLDARLALCREYIGVVQKNKDAIAKVRHRGVLAMWSTGCQLRLRRQLSSYSLGVEFHGGCCGAVVLFWLQELSMQMGKPLDQAKGEVNGLVDRTKCVRRNARWVLLLLATMVAAPTSLAHGSFFPLLCLRRVVCAALFACLSLCACLCLCMSTEQGHDGPRAGCSRGAGAAAQRRPRPTHRPGARWRRVCHRAVVSVRCVLATSRPLAVTRALSCWRAGTTRCCAPSTWSCQRYWPATASS